MISRGFVALVPAVILAGCGGSTMRVAQDDDSAGDSGPVSIAPAPEAGPDSTRSTQPALAADSGQASQAPDSAAAEGYAPYAPGTGDVELRRIGQWTHTGIGESRRLVIRDANAWAQFWAELGQGARPAEDFSRNLVIAVAAGQRSTGGYEIAIQRVSQARGELTIEVLETSPSPNCVTAAAPSQPVDVVVVPGVGAKSWTFLERKEVRACR